MVAFTALLWSLTIPLDKLAVERASAPLHGMVLTAGVAVGVLLVLVFQGRLGDLGQVRRCPASTSSPWWSARCALGLQLLALPQVFVGTMETLKRGIGNFMALLSGWVFFREAGDPAQDRGRGADGGGGGVDSDVSPHHPGERGLGE